MISLEHATRLTLALTVAATVPLAIVYGGCAAQVLDRADAGNDVVSAEPDATDVVDAAELVDAEPADAADAAEAGECDSGVPPLCCGTEAQIGDQCSCDGRRIMHCVQDTTNGCGVSDYINHFYIWNSEDCPNGCDPGTHACRP